MSRSLAPLARHLETATEALHFRYYHFYGSFQTVQDHPRRWYRRAIRAVKLGIGAISRGDAMDFGVRRNGGNGYLRAAPSGADVYHYGWSRPPQVMLDKQRNLESLYHDDAWLDWAYRDLAPDDIYRDLGHLRFFRGTHPDVMRETVAAQNWTFRHGIEQQPPEWLRHSYVGLLRQIRRCAITASPRRSRASFMSGSGPLNESFVEVEAQVGAPRIRGISARSPVLMARRSRI